MKKNEKNPLKVDFRVQKIGKNVEKKYILIWDPHPYKMLISLSLFSVLTLIISL